MRALLSLFLVQLMEVHSADPCEGNNCAANCVSNSCGSNCRGNFCSGQCKGKRCGYQCHGQKCAYQCIGTSCGKECGSDATHSECAYNCQGAECGMDCSGNSCAYQCGNTSPSSNGDPKCGKRCTGDQCAYGCHGNECGKECHGSRCAYGCRGTQCGRKCTGGLGGECAYGCKGPFCGESSTGSSSAHACIGSKCGQYCNGKNCASFCSGGSKCGFKCRGDSCASFCRGTLCGSECNDDLCAKGCAGDQCGRLCEGYECAASCQSDPNHHTVNKTRLNNQGGQCGRGCVGKFCAKGCNGKWCARDCRGEGCAQGCSGFECGRDCRGLNCAQRCEGTDCNQQTCSCTEFSLGGTAQEGEQFVQDKNGKCTLSSEYTSSSSGDFKCVFRNSTVSTTTVPADAGDDVDDDDDGIDDDDDVRTTTAAQTTVAAVCIVNDCKYCWDGGGGSTAGCKSTAGHDTEEECTTDHQNTWCGGRKGSKTTATATGPSATQSPSTAAAAASTTVVGVQVDLDSTTTAPATVEGVVTITTTNDSLGIDVTEKPKVVGTGDGNGDSRLQDCRALLQEQTGATDCFNRGVCKLKRGNCSDPNAPFNVAVCDCGGRPFKGACFYGALCAERTDSCPRGTKSCNVVRKVKVGKDPAPIVCSPAVWPKGLCTADEEIGTFALLSKTNMAGVEKGAVDQSTTREQPTEAEVEKSSSSKLVGIIVGVIVVALLIVAAFYYGHAEGRATSAAITDAVDDIDPAEYRGKGDALTAVTNAAFTAPGHGTGSAAVGGSDHAEVAQPEYAEAEAGSPGRAIVPTTYEEVAPLKEKANKNHDPNNVYLEPRVTSGGEAVYEDVGAADATSTAAPLYDQAGNPIVAEAMYDSAATSTAAPLYDQAGNPIVAEAMYDSAAPLSVPLDETVHSLAATRGATGPPATYEYSTVAGDFSSPMYATASVAKAAEGVTYFLANGDVGATGPTAEYVLANGNAGGDPEYDVATEVAEYLAVLPSVSGTGVQGNAYGMVPPGVRSSSSSGGAKQKVVQIYGSDHGTDDDEDDQVVSSEGMVLQANDFV